MEEFRSTTDPLAALTARLAAIERSNRRQRTVVSVLVLVAGAVATAGAGALVPDTIAARSFRLVDSGGAERAALTTGDAGTAVLTLYESVGRPAVTVTLSSVTPFVVVTDSTGKPATPETRGRIGWGKPAPADGEKEEDKSFDWAD